MSVTAIGLGICSPGSLLLLVGILVGGGPVRLKLPEQAEHMRLNGVGAVCFLILSRDDRLLAVGATSGLITLWDFPSGKLKHSFSSAASPRFFSFSKDGNVLRTPAADKTVRERKADKILWDFFSIVESWDTSTGKRTGS